MLDHWELKGAMLDRCVLGSMLDRWLVDAMRERRMPRPMIDHLVVGAMLDRWGESDADTRPRRERSRNRTETNWREMEEGEEGRDTQYSEGEEQRNAIILHLRG